MLARAAGGCKSARSSSARHRPAQEKRYGIHWRFDPVEGNVVLFARHHVGLLLGVGKAQIKGAAGRAQLRHGAIVISLAIAKSSPPRIERQERREDQARTHLRGGG